MTDYIPPKVDWIASDGLSCADLARIEVDTQYISGQAEAEAVSPHVALPIHKTSSTVRMETSTPFAVEVLTEDPQGTTIATGRMWISSTGG